MKAGKNIVKYCLFLVLALFILVGCKVKRPRGVIAESTMEQLLYDYHIAKAMGDGLPYNENYKRVLYVEDVYKKYGVTEAEFDSSMVWYARNTGIISDIYTKINARLKTDLDEVKRLISIRDNKPITSDPGDSIDVWYLQQVYRITGYPLNNKLSFNLPSDPNFEPRDTLSWRLSYRYTDVTPDSAHVALMAMHIVYENDSIISEIRRLLHSGVETITLQSDTLGTIKEIKGFVYFNAPGDSIRSLWIDSISLIRYHSQDSLFANKDSVPEPGKVMEETVIPVGNPETVETPDSEAKQIETGVVRRTERPRPGLREEVKDTMRLLNEVQ